MLWGALTRLKFVTPLFIVCFGCGDGDTCRSVEGCTDDDGDGIGGQAGSTGASGTGGDTSAGAGGDHVSAGSGGQQEPGESGAGGRDDHGAAGTATAGGEASGGEASGGETSGGAGFGGNPDVGGEGGNGASGGGAEPGSFTCAEDIRITNEAELAEFAALRCTAAGGDLVIESTSLRNLDALAGGPLRVIHGSLNLIDNTVLEDVSGLRGLERIGASLRLISNGSLTGLEGLEDVEQVGQDPAAHSLVFIENGALTSLEALGASAAAPLQLQTNLLVNGNPLLGALRGLSGLTGLPSITIVGNAALTEIGGLTDLDDAESINLFQNPLLATCAFPNLSTTRYLTIVMNDALRTVSLPALHTVSGQLTLSENSALEDVGTLDALTYAGELTILRNPMLPQCFVDALDARLMSCSRCDQNDTSATCD